MLWLSPCLKTALLDLTTFQRTILLSLIINRKQLADFQLLLDSGPFREQAYQGCILVHTRVGVALKYFGQSLQLKYILHFISEDTFLMFIVPVHKPLISSLPPQYTPDILFATWQRVWCWLTWITEEFAVPCLGVSASWLEHELPTPGEGLPEHNANCIWVVVEPN